MKLTKYPALYGILLIIISSCGGNKQESVTVQKVAVEVATVERGDLSVVKTYSGTLEGTKQSIIYAVIPERVMSIPVAEGNYVKKGQPIILLDKNGVASKYNQANAVYQNAKDNYEKMSRLYEQKAISEMNYKSARMAYDVAKADFEAAQATVELSAPIDGIVTEIAVNLGEQVPLGVPIATVASTNKMRLTVYMGNKEIEKMKVGGKARIFIDSNDPISATIIETSKSADPETRLFRVELDMTNAQGYLKPGMYAKAIIVIDKLTDVLTVDNRAIYSEEGISKVYIVQNDTAYSRSIEIGPTDGERTQVLNGLSEGQKTVVVGKSGLRDDIPVILSGRKDSTDVPR